MRGLKHNTSLGSLRSLPVASFTDAWIETVNDAGHTVTTVSHLLQMRGLKPPFAHLMEGLYGFVASFTDAWIETSC